MIQLPVLAFTCWPVQALVLQSWQSTFKPLQGSPPLCGNGLLHTRVRVFTPAPQGFEHWENCDQSPQSPLIGPVIKIRNDKEADNKDSFRSRGVAQLVSALLSVLEVPSSILSDSNVCSDFSLISVTVALKTRKMEHWLREGVKVHRRLLLITVLWTDGTTDVK